jgi:ABC-2 type transport system ATP-binding protein
MLKAGQKLNPRWDEELARERLERLRIPLKQKVGTLSGGQQAQVALTLALAKRPQLLLLDEPVAALDPLARREFLQSLMEAVADGELTVVLSSHIVADLERVCDYMILLSRAEVQLAAPIEQIVAQHRVLSGPRSDPSAVGRVHSVIQESHTARQTTLVVRANGHLYDSRWHVDEVGLEEIVLAYLGRGSESRRYEEVAS